MELRRGSWSFHALTKAIEPEELTSREDEFRQMFQRAFEDTGGANHQVSLKVESHIVEINETESTCKTFHLSDSHLREQIEITDSGAKRFYTTWIECVLPYDEGLYDDDQIKAKYLLLTDLNNAHHRDFNTLCLCLIDSSILSRISTRFLGYMKLAFSIIVKDLQFTNKWMTQIASYVLRNTKSDLGNEVYGIWHCWYNMRLVFEVDTDDKNLKNIELDIDKKSIYFLASEGTSEDPIADSVFPHIHERTGLLCGELPLVELKLQDMITLNKHMIQFDRNMSDNETKNPYKFTTFHIIGIIFEIMNIYRRY